MPDFRPALLLAAFLLAGCASAPPPAWRAETFASDSPFYTHSDLAPAESCDVGRRALLSQGYEVESPASATMRGNKFFQPQPDQMMQLKITLVCIGNRAGTTVYASALQTRYELKSTGTSTGVSVAGFGSISLPLPTDKGSLVKVGEETVGDPAFYQRLFTLIDTLAMGAPRSSPATDEQPGPAQHIAPSDVSNSR
ncbi:MAG: DUF2242 domain-containing protein [Betaproteobacteria bacterium]|nr:DUF2242 domain-containing protein [Betaproteobacteria bacterium]